ARAALRQACGKLSEGEGPEQILLYDLAYMASALEAAEAMADYGERGEVEQKLATVFVADALHDVRTRLDGRASLFGLDEGVIPSLPEGRDPELLSDLAGEAGPSHLDEDFAVVRDAFRRFAEERLMPVAEEVHRTNADIPEDIIQGLAEMGCFGMSIPEQYGGFSTGGEGEFMGMV